MTCSRSFFRFLVCVVALVFVASSSLAFAQPTTTATATSGVAVGNGTNATTNQTGSKRVNRDLFVETVMSVVAALGVPFLYVFQLLIRSRARIVRLRDLFKFSFMPAADVDSQTASGGSGGGSSANGGAASLVAEPGGGGGGLRNGRGGGVAAAMMLGSKGASPFVLASPIYSPSASRDGNRPSASMGKSSSPTCLEVLCCCCGTSGSSSSFSSVDQHRYYNAHGRGGDGADSSLWCCSFCAPDVTPMATVMAAAREQCDVVTAVGVALAASGTTDGLFPNPLAAAAAASAVRCDRLDRALGVAAAPSDHPGAAVDAWRRASDVWAQLKVSHGMPRDAASTTLRSDVFVTYMARCSGGGGGNAGGGSALSSDQVASMFSSRGAGVLDEHQLAALCQEVTAVQLALCRTTRHPVVPGPDVTSSIMQLST